MSNTWLVSQGRNYEIERNGKYIWAPKCAEDGTEKFFWTNLTKLMPGDIIIHYSLGLRAVSQVLEKCTESPDPNAPDQSEILGWLVKCDYMELEKFIRVINFKDEILQYSSDDQAPFNSKGNIKQGYLFKLNETLASIFLKAMIKKKSELAEVPVIKEFMNREFEIIPIDPDQRTKKPGADERMTNQMLSNLERLMALHESTQLVKPQKKIDLPRLIRKKDIEPIEISKETVKELVDTKIRKFLEDGTINEDEIYDMRFVDYSEENFGIEYPLLVRAKALTFDDMPKYFRQPIIINNEKFCLYSNWTENQRDKIEMWINKIEAKLNALPEYQGLNIRDLVKSVMRNILVAKKVSPEELELLLTKEYSEKTFGIKYAALTKDRNPSNVTNYFKMKVPINDETYYLCSQWFEQPKNNNRPMLEKWIKEHRDNEPFNYEEGLEPEHMEESKELELNIDDDAENLSEDDMKKISNIAFDEEFDDD